MVRSGYHSERGAIIIQVAVALLALTAFSAFVIDYGVLWTSRGHAQDAADAGALAAAINLESNPTNTAAAIEAARRFANANPVWGENPLTPDILVQTGLTCPPGSGGGPGCVRVDVLRGSTDRNGGLHSNTLPTIFLNILGINSQAINATAMAQVGSGNAVSCMKPWILPDKWIDNNEAPIGGWSQNDTYQPPTDTYTAPGFKYPDDQGTQMLLKGDANAWSAGWVQEIDLGGGNGASVYNAEIEGCPSWVPVIGIYDGTVPCVNRPDENFAKGCINVRPGVAQGPTSSGVTTIVGLDPGATWNDVTKTVNSPCEAANTCQDADGNHVAISGRIVPVALFNPDAYWTESLSCSGNNCMAEVSNIFGYFIEGMCNDVYPNQATRPAWCGTNSEANKTVVGRMMQYPGQNLGGPTNSSFAQAVRLVR